MASCTLSASSQTSSKAESVFPFEFYDSPASVNAESLHVMNSADHSFDLSHCEITEAEKDGGGSLYDSDKKERARGQAEDNSIVSAVQLLGDGGYSLVTFPNIKPEDMDARGILKQSPLHSINGQDHLTKQQKFARSKVWVDINLPDNEISLLRIRRNLSFSDSSAAAAEPPTPPSPSPHSSSLASASIGRIFKGKAPATARGSLENGGSGGGRQAYRSTRTVVEVLRELDADIVALQDVKAEEEREMKPLSELAAALGMSYAFAESWAPEYGNAVLSRWPIKHLKVQKIFDDTDFRNVLKATIEVPHVGEVNFQCTHLDHLDENWRMKQVGAIIQSSDSPHILAGGLNSLDETDYSQERWTDIVKYYEEMGKPTPKVEVMRFLKSKQYTDAKDFAGECESVVVIAKGQSVQGTCKYGTRVDYLLASPDCPYKFIPGSYSVLSSKGTSDHHIVKVDVTKCENNPPHESNGNNNKITKKRRRQRKHQAVVKISGTAPPSKGIWTTNTLSKVE